MKDPLRHFASIQKAICRAYRGAEGLRKVEPADTLSTVVLAMSCNCKVFFIYIYIYIYISFLILPSVKYPMSCKDGSV